INKQNLLFACLIGEGKFKSVQGVVTSYSGNYGWIESLISFNADVVTGHAPLRVGQTVTAHVEFQNTSGLKATQSKDGAGSLRCGRKTRGKLGDKKRRRETTGFMPYRGDWLEVEYFKPWWTSKLNVLSAKPTKVKHLQEAGNQGWDGAAICWLEPAEEQSLQAQTSFLPKLFYCICLQVYITFLKERHGMIEYSIFFTLDSLELPPGYEPKMCDVVNVTIVESSHVFSDWRAISMSP
ncbi:hypothetical protein A6R68_15063, partial [Neotoma lepida]